MTNQPTPPATAGVERVHVAPDVEEKGERRLSDILRGMIDQMDERRASRQRMKWVTDASYGESWAGVHVTVIVSRDPQEQETTFDGMGDTDHGIRQGL